MNQDLSKLKTRVINNAFIEIDYLGEKLILRQHDNYINITKICNEYNKKINDYTDSKKGKEIIEKIFSLVNNGNNFSSIEPLVYIKGSNNLKGTYVHPILAISIITWIDIDLYFKLYNFFNRYKDLIDQYSNFISNQIKPNNINKEISNEEKFIKTIYEVLDNSKLTKQYRIDNYKIDCVYEDDEIILIEFDEKEHKKYDRFHELKRYKTIFDKLTQNKITILRFSDSIIYTNEMICDIIKYVDNINTNQNIIYINYSNENKIHVTDILNNVIVYSY